METVITLREYVKRNAAANKAKLTVVRNTPAARSEVKVIPLMQNFNYFKLDTQYRDSFA